MTTFNLNGSRLQGFLVRNDRSRLCPSVRTAGQHQPFGFGRTDPCLQLRNHILARSGAHPSWAAESGRPSQGPPGLPRAAVGVVGRADRVEWASLVRDRSLRRAATIQCWGLAQAQRPHPREKRVFDHSVSPQCGALAATRPGPPRGVGHAVRPIVETASCCLTRGVAHVARPSRDLKSVMGWRPQTSAHQLRVKHYHS